LINYYTSEIGDFNLCLAGGVFANVKLNSVIKKIKNLKKLYIFPNMSDGGLVVGACYEFLRRNKDNSFRSAINNSMYLGPSVSPAQMRALAENNSLKSYQLEINLLIDRCIEILGRGGLIALCQGRSEFGPRALGNRSLLALATGNDVVKKINQQLHRDEFMPFAPVMMLEKVRDLIDDFDEHDSTSKYMVSTFAASDILKKSSPAVVHIDNSCRIQTVSVEDNEFLFKLLDKLNSDYSIDCLINTSFNMHEEPIVSDELSIISTFIKSKVDVLVSPPYLFTR
jgi:carbamoyltransferase